MDVKYTYRNTKAKTSLSVVITIPELDPQDQTVHDIVEAGVREWTRLRLGEYSRKHEGKDPENVDGSTFTVPEFLTAIGRDSIDRVPQAAKDLYDSWRAMGIFDDKTDEELLDFAVASVKGKEAVAKARRAEAEKDDS